MLEIITEKAEISRAENTFRKTMNRVADKTEKVLIGWQGGNTRDYISWSNSLGIWWTTSRIENKFWNAFGSENPHWNSKYSHSIDCEINVPFSGIDYSISGAFAKDEDGRLYLLHRGNIRGGKKGIGKTRFVENFTGEWENAMEVEYPGIFALVGMLSSPRFPNQVATFVTEVKRIKALQHPARAAFFRNQFSKEHYGTEIVHISGGETERKCDHGLIVDTLAELLKSKRLSIGNNDYVDLFTTKGNTIMTMFEIKTDSTLQCCYEAIGQLLFHSSNLPRKPKLVAVFPDKKYQETFEQIGIHLATYTWAKDLPKFHNLPKSL
jgi:hypothetical protein